jgi:uncharacterized protein (TIGR03000 family)
MPAKSHLTGPVFFACLALLCAALVAPDASAQTNGGGGPFTATVEVRVPTDAELWFDGTAMAQTGDRRAFTTPALNPRLTYTYDVTARWRDGGKDVVRNERVLVRAGETTAIDFTRPVTRGSAYMGVRDVTNDPTRTAALPQTGYASLIEISREKPPPTRIAGHMAVTEVKKPAPGDRPPAGPATRTVPAAGYMSIVEIDTPRR